MYDDSAVARVAFSIRSRYQHICILYQYYYNNNEHSVIRIGNLGRIECMQTLHLPRGGKRLLLISIKLFNPEFQIILRILYLVNHVFVLPFFCKGRADCVTKWRELVYDDNNAEMQGQFILHSSSCLCCLIVNQYYHNQKKQYKLSNFKHFVELVTDIPVINSRNEPQMVV